MDLFVTIFTATFNRKNLLKRLYLSLTKQTDYHFEWLIVDDGSEDGSIELLEHIVKSKKNFKVRCIHTKNGGKHRAINIGVQMASYEAFFIVDSDDYLVPDAIENVREWFVSIQNDSNYFGVSGLKYDSTGKPLGGIPKSPYLDINNLERDKFDMWGEQAEVYKTSMLKKCPFPEYENENFIGEGAVVNKISKSGVLIRWYPIVTCICEYQPDGLTYHARDLRINNPHGWFDEIVANSPNEQKKYAQLLNWYLWTCNKHYDVIQEYAVTHSKEIEILINISNNLTDEIKTLFEKYSDDGIAIYGLGNRGLLLFNIASKIGCHFSYAVDKKDIEFDGINIYHSLTAGMAKTLIITVKKDDLIIGDLAKDYYSNIFYFNEMWANAVAKALLR